MNMPAASAGNPQPHPSDVHDTDPPVSTLMSRKVVGIVPHAPLSTALHLMTAAGVRHLPVFDGPECVGVLIESDVIERLAEASGALITVPAEWVSHACRRPPVTLPPSGRRSDVAVLMVRTGMDVVLVRDGDRIVGIVTATDLVRSLSADHDAPSADVAVTINS